MSFGVFFAIVVFGILMGAQLLLRSHLLWLSRKLFFLSIIVIFGLSFYFAFAQYQNWQEGSLTQFFLPPHQGISYFLVDVGKKIFSPWLIAIIAAIVVPRIAERLNKKYRGRFFHDEEIGLMRIAVFLTGYPGFLLYLVFILIAELLLTTYYLLFTKGPAPLYYLWLPMAIFAIIVKTWLIPRSMLALFAL